MSEPLICIDDIRDFDAVLKQRISSYRQKLQDWLSPHRLTLREARVHKVLIPMVGVYTPGWQALPACSWGYIELVTDQGLVGTGEWSIDLDAPAQAALERLKHDPSLNLLDFSFEEPLFMAWWDLVGQVLGKPLHHLWAELFENEAAPKEKVPTAAYTWQRFPDIDGKDEVTYETWPDHAAMRARQGFPAIKVSMTGYDPEDYVELLYKIREKVGPDTLIRADTHGTWNLQEARRILRKLEDCDLEFIEQPFGSLLPQCSYRAGEPIPARGGGRSYQSEYYFRNMTELRRETSIPLSCHWWTPPIVHPEGASVSSNQWEIDWPMMERYNAADIAAPDIGLGVWGLWRLAQIGRFAGMHITVHSNFEMCTQLAFRCAMTSALVYDSESAGLYLGAAPRRCHAIDNETLQVSADLIEGGQFSWEGGHVTLSESPGHGLRLDPDLLKKYAYTPENIAPHREYAKKLYANYKLDRPRKKTMAGWPKLDERERFDRHTYPYDVANILGAEDNQTIDVELNR